VQPHTEYRQLPENTDTDGPVRTTLYVQVDPAGHAGEGFRFPLHGGNISVDIWGQDIFEDTSMHRFRFRYELQAHDIDIRSNAFNSKWENWEELLARGTLTAFSGKNTTDVTSDVRKFFLQKLESRPEFGAALRWSIQARGGEGLWAILQSLPRPAGFLRKDARFTTDYCGAIDVAAIKLTVAFNPDNPCRGPIPTLFSRDVNKTVEELTDNPELLCPGKISKKLRLNKPFR